MCHPVLVLPFLQVFDVANARVGAERNPLKTEVIYYAQHRLSGTLATCGAWPKPLQSPAGASAQTSS